MSLLESASLILTPNGYKSGKLYSIIPSSGNGDLTFTRATSASRVNSSGLIENVLTGVPRLDYSGSSASILLEPQRTNLIVNSVWAGGGTVPTSWTKNLTTITTTPITSSKNPNVIAYNFSGSNGRGHFFQIEPFTINTTSSISVYVESVTVPTAIFNILQVVNATGSQTFYKNNVLTSSASNIEAGNTYSINFAASGSSVNSEVRFGLGAAGNATGNFTISMPQVESGSYATSYIPTTTSTVTRNVDVMTLNNLYTNNLITSAGGTWFFELINNFSYARDSPGSFTLQTSQTSDDNGLVIKVFTVGGATSRLQVNKRLSDVETTIYTTLTDRVKIAVDWNGTTADVFVNGVKVVTATPFTITNMNYFISAATDVPRYIRQMALFPTPLSDAECITLTTL